MAQPSLLMLMLLFCKLPLNIDLFAFDEEVDSLGQRAFRNSPGFAGVPEVFVNTAIETFNLYVYRVFSLVGGDDKFLDVLMDPLETLGDVVQLFAISFLLVVVPEPLHHCLLHFPPRIEDHIAEVVDFSIAPFGHMDGDLFSPVSGAAISTQR